MMNKIIPGLIIFLFFLTACKDSLNKGSGSTADNKKIYVVNIAQSKVNWAGYKVENRLNLNHFGIVEIQKGKIIEKENQIIGGDLILDMTTLTVDNEENAEKNIGLLFRLMGADYLDTTNYPTANFKINSVTKIEGASDYNSQINVTLTLKNSSKDIPVKANIRKSGNKIYIYTEKFVLNRHDFNIQYGEEKWNLTVDDEFDLQMTLIADLN